MGQLRGKYIWRGLKVLRRKQRFWGLDKRKRRDVRTMEIPPLSRASTKEKQVLRFAQDDEFVMDGGVHLRSFAPQDRRGRLSPRELCRSVSPRQHFRPNYDACMSRRTNAESRKKPRPRVNGIAPKDAATHASGSTRAISEKVMT
jgi:hypothetical protein